jgi:hypothetical protein
MNLSVNVKKTNKFKWDDKENEKMENIYLRPLIAPVNHNTLNYSKTFQIVHTLMGNFCHGDKNKISHMEDMGNNATMLIGYHDKVCFEVKLFSR